MKNQVLFFRMNHFVTAVKAFLLVFMLSFFGTGIHNACAGAISQSPLFVSTTNSVKPNLMLILDDSGSMMFEIMPDDYTYWGKSNGSIPYLFPLVSKVYGTSDYSNNVATTNDSSAYAAVVRSSNFNTLYYNPAITYEPWTEHNGKSLYPPASRTCPYHNPEKNRGWLS